MKYAICFFLVFAFVNAASGQTEKGPNDYYYKVVRKDGKLLSVEECKQSTGGHKAQVAKAKTIGFNIKDGEPKFYKNSMWSTLSFRTKQSKKVLITEEHFTGISGDMWANGMKDCKTHFSSQELKKK